MHIILTIFLLMISCTCLASQRMLQDSILTTTDVKEQTLHGIYTSLYIMDDQDIEDWDDIQEQLTTLALNPRNINDVTFDELIDIPLISEQQALAVIRYRHLYGDLHTMSELSLVTGLDRPYQQLIKQLFYAAPSTNTTTISPSTTVSGASAPDSAFLLKDAPFATYANTRKHTPFDYGHHNILLTATIPTYTRQGYKDGTYRGYQYNHSLRYNYLTPRFQAALTAAQDAGEPFFSGTNKKGYDFYTGFVRLKNTSFIKDLVIGHYQISCGMGLIINNSYRLSRTALLLTQPQQRLTLRGHSSRQESNYLQGIATTLRLAKYCETTLFASYRPLDATTAPISTLPTSTLPATTLPTSTAPTSTATVSEASASDDYTITTIQTTGYHRTDSEINHRNATHQTTLGASLTMTTTPTKSMQGAITLTALHTHMANAFLPDTSKLYKRFAPYGKDFTNASLAYTLLLPHQRLNISGETALSITQHPSPNTHLATSNIIRYRINSSLSLFALQRFYSYQFISLLGKSFGDVSNTQDESGIYLGMSGLNIHHTTLSAYLDYAYHPWPRYGHTTSTSSYDAYLQAIYQHRATTFTARYRCRYQDATQHTLRTLYKYSPYRSRWDIRTQLQGTIIPSTHDWGYLLSQSVAYSFPTPLRRNATPRQAPLSVSLTYFNTSDYATRLYITDRTVTYGSMTSMLFGHGMRMNIMMQLPLSNALTLSTHVTSTQYFDRSQISSSHQMIDASNQTDIQLQLRIRI